MLRLANRLAYAKTFEFKSEKRHTNTHVLKYSYLLEHEDQCEEHLHSSVIGQTKISSATKVTTIDSLK